MRHLRCSQQGLSENKDIMPCIVVQAVADDFGNHSVGSVHSCGCTAGRQRVICGGSCGSIARMRADARAVNRSTRQAARLTRTLIGTDFENTYHVRVTVPIKASASSYPTSVSNSSEVLPGERAIRARSAALASQRRPREDHISSQL